MLLVLLLFSGTSELFSDEYKPAISPKYSDINSSMGSTIDNRVLHFQNFARAMVDHVEVMFCFALIQDLLEI